MADPLSSYGRQLIDDDDIAAVAVALRADFLTTGPEVAAFEVEFAEAVGAQHAVACSNGTAALHLALMALGIGEGDLCIVPSTTFLATANAVRYVGAEVLFCDVDPASGLMTPYTLSMAIHKAGLKKAKAVLPVHLRGEVCELPALAALAHAAGGVLVEDAAHALGSTMTFHGGEAERVGDNTHGALATFSFHPVKTITTGEGGMITTADPELAARLRRFRSHGMSRPADAEPWLYEMAEPGFNYRLPDINCALGRSQLRKLPFFAFQRRVLARAYADQLAALAPAVIPAAAMEWSDPVLHLMTVLIDFAALGVTRAEVTARLAAQGVATQVHYIPVHSQPYYRDRYGDLDLPGAQAWYDRCLSLPLHPGMEAGDVERAVAALKQAVGL
jgi:UDP-4-amino-4,6-dideoxy-N-acetyl-beta-L-altrosamine transaminase